MRQPCELGVLIALAAIGAAGCSMTGPPKSSPAPVEEAASPANDSTASTVPPVVLEPQATASTGGPAAASSPIVLRSAPPPGGFVQSPIVTRVDDPARTGESAQRELLPQTPPVGSPEPVDLAASGARAGPWIDPALEAAVDRPQGGLASRAIPEDWAELREATLRVDRKVQERLDGLERRLLALMQDQRGLEVRVESSEKALEAIRDRLDSVMKEEVERIRTGVKGAQETARDVSQSQRNQVLPKLQTLEGLVKDHATTLEDLGTRVDFALSLLQGEAVAEAKRLEEEGGSSGTKARPSGEGRKGKRGRKKSPSPGGPRREPGDDSGGA